MTPKFILSLFCLLVSITSSSRINNDTINFTCYSNGKIYVGTYLDNNCFHSLEKEVEDNTLLFISGVERCEKNNSKKRIYEIVLDGKFYLVSEEKLKVDTNFFSRIISKDSTFKAQIRLNAINKENIYKNNQNKADSIIKAELHNTFVSFINQTSNKGLTLFDYKVFDESDFTEGTGIKFHIYNPTNKIIKYVWFNFIGYNPVDDPVSSLNGIQQTTKGVGPIHPKNEAIYKFNYVWYNDLVERIKITSIKVQFMDGSIKTINQINQITLPNKYYTLYTEGVLNY